MPECPECPVCQRPRALRASPLLQCSNCTKLGGGPVVPTHKFVWLGCSTMGVRRCSYGEVGSAQEVGVEYPVPPGIRALRP